jgi:hypothetical protein
MELTVAGLDPSLRNWGLAKGIYDTETDTLRMIGIDLQETAIQTTKTVRKSSDYLRRAGLLASATQAWIAGCDAVCGEIPTGSQSASGSMSNGICVGVMSWIGLEGSFRGRLVQVDPSEVKRAAVGSKNASKEEMIEWAMKKYPHLPWLLSKSGKTKGEPIAKNEHMADATAAIEAGIRTPEFRSLIQMLNNLVGKTQSS